MSAPEGGRAGRDCLLECVINLSEGRRPEVIAAIASSAASALLDVHSDRFHNRSVLTLGGPGTEQAARAVAAEALRLLDIRLHEGVHPRLGVVDVVPFVSLGALDDNPIGGAPALPGVTDDFAGEVLTARDSFARWFAGEGVPCFFYGPERSLPEVRRHAFGDLPPDLGPPTPHLSAGACCVGARPILIAYNLVLAAGATLADGKGIAAELRRKELRTLGLATGDEVQVSCNLVAPDVVGPAEAYDAVAARAAVARAELVGLLPRRVLHRIDRDRWTQLDLDGSKTIESRLARQQAR